MLEYNRNGMSGCLWLLVAGGGTGQTSAEGCWGGKGVIGKRERERKRETEGRVRGRGRGAEEVSNCRVGLNLPGGTSAFISTQSKW